MIERREQRYERKPLALVELLVVLVLVGILVSIVVFAVGSVTDQDSAPAGRAGRSLLV
jgi:Tfp pilus assembly protein FimT